MDRRIAELEEERANRSWMPNTIDCLMRIMIAMKQEETETI